MSLHAGPRTIVAPDGVQWRVARRWSTRRFGWTWKRRSVAADALSGLGQGIDGVDFQEGGLMLVAVLAALLIVIPLLFFGVELIILGALLAAGAIGRVMFRQPWVIEAWSKDPLMRGRRLEWTVIGWRKSQALIETVSSDLAAGREPPQRTLLS
ncbi:MAG: hypothetical protein JO363_16685 [Solirubrobacterales bacterium]|nr:hypothetical protein [Solirubrobacterales bacterium]